MQFVEAEFAKVDTVEDLPIVLQSIAYFVGEGEDGLAKARFMKAMQEIMGAV